MYIEKLAKECKKKMKLNNNYIKGCVVLTRIIIILKKSQNTK